MELYLLTTILLVLMGPGNMMIEARFDISSSNVLTKDTSSDDTCLEQTVLHTHEELRKSCGMMHEEQPSHTRIINGYEAKPGQFPFAVKITNNTLNGHSFCGGSIIDSKHILTAAHCITYNGTRIPLNVSEFTIEVGAHFYNLSSEDKDCRVKHAVKELHVHPFYLDINRMNDIGIIELEEPINFEYYRGGYGSRGPICLSQSDEKLVGLNLSVAGWGRASIFKHSPEMLNYDTYQVLNQSSCISSSENEICMLETNIYKSSYFGDSGSALFTKNNNQSYMQVGIVSRPDWCRKVQLGYQKGNKVDICYLTIYTRVDSHLDWIELIIGRKPVQQ